MNRFSAILGLLAIAALSALIGARAQVIDWVPFEPAPSEFPREAFRTIVPQSCGGTAARANPPGQDPGVRAGAASAGGFLPGLSANELAIANTAAFWYSQPWTLTGQVGGLGPRYATNGCFECHAYPAPGGSSPIPNTEVALANLNGATNTVPSFITSNGPTRIPYQISTGSILKLYTVKGMTGAEGCTLAQPDFPALLTNNDLSYHIPVPLFGLGLVEATPSANFIAAQTTLPGGVSWTLASLGITSGRFNHSVDGISTLGWKGGVSSIKGFSDLALSVDLGVSSVTYPRKDDEVASCIFNPVPDDFGPRLTRLSPNSASVSADYSSQSDLYSAFIKYLAPPAAVTSYISSVVGAVTTASIANGRARFISDGCVACHTQDQTTGANVAIASPTYKSYTYTPWSDYALHNMGTGLRDGLSFGAAGPQDFRTSALWGTGQRYFFLHDGRTQDLNAVIQAHKSTGSEASTTVDNFNADSTGNQQDILNFLRSL